MQQDDTTPVVSLAFHGRCLRDSILAGHLHRVVQAVVYRWIVWLAFHIYKARQHYYGRKLTKQVTSSYTLRVLKLCLPTFIQNASSAPAFEAYDTMLFFCPEAAALQAIKFTTCERLELIAA